MLSRFYVLRCREGKVKMLGTKENPEIEKASRMTGLRPGITTDGREPRYPYIVASLPAEIDSNAARIPDVVLEGLTSQGDQVMPGVQPVELAEAQSKPLVKLKVQTAAP